MSASNGYFDLQVNGYVGVDFNSDDLTAEGLHKACTALEEHGVAGIFATVITDRIDAMCNRLATLVRLREGDSLARKLIPGIHIEGPFLNATPGYAGAHPADTMTDTDIDAMQRLLDAAGGLTKLVTLAPERDPGFTLTRKLCGMGVTVSAGHCDPTLDQLKGAIDAGLSMVTHLGNGCPMQMHRHENIIQRVLSLRDELNICFIADGAHVAFTALGNYIALAGLDRTVVVTDAISAAGLGPGTYTLAHWTVKIGPDMVARAPDGSHLLGAAITMPATFDNLTKQLGLSADDARKLLCENPRKAVGMD